MSPGPPSNSEGSTHTARTARTTTSDTTPVYHKGSAFWLTFIAVVVSIFVSALDLTAVGTTLPTITADLNGGDNFSWIGSAYALSSTAILPLSGSLADIFGRRPVMLSSVVIFALGSALAGAAQSMNMLIAARTVQGIGAGAILNLSDIITSDIVPLADRGLYQGFVGLTWALASGIGPPIGGAFAAQASWRWLFYMNLPLIGIAFFLVLFFLRVRTPEGSIKEKLARIDWFGNVLVIAGTTLAVIGLTFGGIRYPWIDAHTLAPLIIGLSLIVIFIFYEAKVPKEPTIPWEVMSNRTTVGGYIGTFIHGISSIALVYYLPVYFQAVLSASPIRSGVDILPTSLVVSVFALLSGASVEVLKRYRPANVAAWIMMIVGFGVLSLMKAGSSTSQWVGYQIIVAAGVGILYASPVFPILAPLPVERNASALAFFSFLRSFAETWGIAISSTILQNELKHKLPPSFSSRFPGGREIAYSAIPLIAELQEPLRTEVRVAFAESMSVIWKVMTGISAVGLLSVLLLKEISMHVHTDETYGIDEGKQNGSDVVSDEEKDTNRNTDTKSRTQDNEEPARTTATT